MAQTNDQSNAEIIMSGFTLKPLSLDIVSNINNQSILNVSVNVQSSSIHLNNTSGSSKDITGFESEDNGHFLFLTNISAQNIVLKHNDALSDAENRLINIGAADKTLAQYATACYQYITSAGINKWVQVF